MEDSKDLVRDKLSHSYLSVNNINPFLFDNIDAFVALSRDNTSLEDVELYPFDGNGERTDEFLEKVGQMVGNLSELQTITIRFEFCTEAQIEGFLPNEAAPRPDWEIITRILRYLRRKVAICTSRQDHQPEGEDIQGLASVIHGHAMISGFHSEMGFTFANFGPWCSALATLPSLESVTIGLRELETEDQSVLVDPEPLAKLLRAPSLQFVDFDGFSFTNTLCHVAGNALEEGSSVTDITFNSSCSFPDGGRAIIANALKINTSVTGVTFLGDCDEPFCNTLAEVLLCNSTLQNLTLLARPRDRPHASGRWFSSIFLSLGTNTTLKSLSVSTFNELGEDLCAAIRTGLVKNSTLEELSLRDMVPSGDDGAVSARNALSFLRANSTLKSLKVQFVESQMESYVSAFRLEALKMLEENPFLESISIQSSSSSVKVEELFALISALQLNTTLKTLGLIEFSGQYDHYIDLTNDEVNQLVSILMKNYGLEEFSPDISGADDRTVKAILRLNGAGRRYLIEDGSSISKGVEVLSAVNDDIHCVFLHLLENPGLCNRRAVKTETTTGSRRPGGNPDESSSSGKRERAQSQPDKEPRRRLA
jgi:hypothetical protein